MKLVSCQINTPDGIWEYSELENLPDWEVPGIEEFVTRRVELQAMQKYWETLDVSTSIREWGI